MKSATGILRREHEEIERALEVIEVMARQVAAGERTEPQDLLDATEYLATFVDRAHDAKEDEILFVALERHGIPRSGAPLAMLRREHESGRQRIRQMILVSQAYARGAADSAEKWAKDALAYAAVQRRHMHRENEMLFAIAERALDERELDRLGHEMERLEAEQLPAETRERLVRALDRLRGEILVAVLAG